MARLTVISCHLVEAGDASEDVTASGKQGQSEQASGSFTNAEAEIDHRLEAERCQGRVDGRLGGSMARNHVIDDVG